MSVCIKDGYLVQDLDLMGTPILTAGASRWDQKNEQTLINFNTFRFLEVNITGYDFRRVKEVHGFEISTFD